MSNIGKRVRLTGGYAERHSCIEGEVLNEEKTIFEVKLDNGLNCYPSSPESCSPECEYIEIPEKWCIDIRKLDEKQRQKFADWLPSDFQSYKKEILGGASYLFHFPNFDDSKSFKDGYHSGGKVEPGYKEITFEQFKKYIMRIGYKLKKEFNTPEYLEAIEKLTNTLVEGNPLFYSGSIVAEKLEKIGLLNIWFEEAKKQFKKGDIVICTSDGDKGLGWEFNRILIIDSIDNNEVAFAEKGHGVYFNSLRLATAEEIKEFESVEFLGYKAEFKEPGYVSFGCQVISKGVLIALKDLFEREAFSFSAKIGDEDLNINHVDKILKRL